MSTILYLIALQGVTVTPFRVVDEINQVGGGARVCLKGGAGKEGCVPTVSDTQLLLLLTGHRCDLI